MTDEERRARIPKDLKANCALRKALLERCRTDAALRRGLVEACRRDVLFWVDLFVIQVDPKQKGHLGLPSPFVTYPFQEEALPRMLSWVGRGRDGLIEKSRQMGASWMLIMLFTWLWLFRPWQTFLFISRNESAVENEDPNSLFWKLDFILRHLPSWMRPAKFRRRKRFFGNDDKNSFVFGEASTGSANVGGNTTAMGIDEFSQIKEGYEVLHRTSDSTQCRIFNSTHLGLDTAFYELTQRVDLDKLVLHWSEHPVYAAGAYRVTAGKVVPLDPHFEYPADYDFVRDGTPTGGPHPGVRSPWYDEQCKRKGSARAIAMDLDINPSGSVTQVFDALVIQALKEAYCREPLWRGELEYDAQLGRPKAFSPLGSGRLRLWSPLGPGGMPAPARYVVGGDLSTGQGRTPSVLSVVRADTGEKVGEWVSSEVPPLDLAPLAVALCWAFKDQDGRGARLGWEVPGPGLAFGKKVIELGYRDVFYRESIDAVNPSPTDLPGWVNNRPEKRLLLEQYKNALQYRKFLNPSREALLECLSFKYTAEGGVEHTGEAAKNSPADARENHGDRVIADALAWRLCKARSGPRSGPAEAPPAHPGTLSGRRELWEAERREAGLWA